MSKSYPSILLSLLNEVGKQVGVGNFLILLKTDSVPPLSYPQASRNFPHKKPPQGRFKSHSQTRIGTLKFPEFLPLIPFLRSATRNLRRPLKQPPTMLTTQTRIGPLKFPDCFLLETLP